MIDITKEKLITLVEAAALLPSSRRGKKTHFVTLARWRKHGSRGVRLECVRVGGSWMTSIEAVQRFVDRLSAAQVAGSKTPPPLPTLHEREVVARLQARRLLPKEDDEQSKPS